MVTAYDARESIYNPKGSDEGPSENLDDEQVNFDFVLETDDSFLSADLPAWLIIV